MRKLRITPQRHTLLIGDERTDLPVHLLDGTGRSVRSSPMSKVWRCVAFCSATL